MQIPNRSWLSHDLARALLARPNREVDILVEDSDGGQHHLFKFAIDKSYPQDTDITLTNTAWDFSK